MGLSKLNLAINQLEQKRLKMTKPINEGLREINNTFKEVKAPLQSAYVILDGKVMAWRSVEQEKREKEKGKAILFGGIWWLALILAS